MYDPHDKFAPTRASPAGFAAFTSISAFANCGLSLRPNFRGAPVFFHLVGGTMPLKLCALYCLLVAGNVNLSVYLILDILCLAGNTLFPVLLRWTVIALSRFSADDSNRKVYFRYRLINGRNHYTHLFTSQQTWLLLSLQAMFTCFQAVCLRWLGDGVNDSEAVFTSINTRHAGFDAVNLGEQNAGILVLFLAMMFLAPTPFAVVLQRSDREATKPKDTEEFLSNLPIKLADSGHPSVDPLGGPVLSWLESSLGGSSANSAALLGTGLYDAGFGDDGFIKAGVLASNSARDGNGCSSESYQGVSVKRTSSVGWRGLGSSDVSGVERKKSRVLAMNLAEAGLGADEDVGNSADDDPFADTRLVLMKRYGGEAVPLHARVS